MRRSRILAGLLPPLLALGLLASTPRPAEAQITFFDERVEVSGYLDFLNIARANDLSEDWHWVGNRMTLNVEVDIDLLGPSYTGPWDEAKLFFIVKPRYDFVYSFNSDDWGDSAKVGGVNNLKAGDGFGVHPDHIFRQRFPGTSFPLDVPYTPRFEVPRGACPGNCNLSESDLAWGRTDTNPTYPLREFYLDAKRGDWAFRIGKQQVVWGKTDFFRLQDVINPVDYGVHSFLDGLEDIRIPQWMITSTYKFHDIGFMKDASLELVWNVDRYSPLGLGQAGEPWAHIFGEEIKAFARFFPTYGVGLQKTNLPAWTLKNTQYGGRFEFLLGRVRVAISDYYRFQDVPVFQLVRDFTRQGGNPGALLLPPDQRMGPLGLGGGVFEIIFPRVNIAGISLDYFEEVTQTVWRVEATYTSNEDFVNTLSPNHVSESDVIRWSVGVDRQTFIRFLNPTRSFFLSAQIFVTHILDHEERNVLVEPGDPNSGLIDAGYINWDDDVTATFFFLGWYLQDRLILQGFTAYQFQADATASGLQFEYLLTDNWSLKVGAHVIGGERHTFDNRPFQAFAGGDGETENYYAAARESFGADRDRDEVFFAFRYRF